MRQTGITPDFITVDGGEGGTGAAPPEYSNSVGFPLYDGLAFVADTLLGFDLRHEVRVICSGKIISGFHMARVLAIGADMTNSARGMMLALGCIQALECNRNICPTGITTQNPGLVAGLVVSDKTERVANFHRQTVKSLAELLTAAGLDHPEELTRSHICRRTSSTEIKHLDEIYPNLEPGCMLNGGVPAIYRRDFDVATADSFLPVRN